MPTCAECGEDMFGRYDRGTNQFYYACPNKCNSRKENAKIREKETELPSRRAAFNDKRRWEREGVE